MTRAPGPRRRAPARGSAPSDYVKAAAIVRGARPSLGLRRPPAPASRCCRSTRPCSTCWPWWWPRPGSGAGRRWSRRCVGIASFDFFFVHPFYTFSVSDVRYVLTFGVMLVVALVLGNLTGRIRSQAEAAREREQRTSALYGLSRELGGGAGPGRGARRGPEEPAGHVRHRRRRAPSRRGGRSGRRRCAAVPARRSGAGRGAVELRSRPGGGPGDDHPARLPARCTCRSSRRARRSGSSGSRSAEPAEFRDPARRRLLESLAGQTAAALERLALAERSRESEVEVEAERLRTALAELALSRHAHAARVDRRARRARCCRTPSPPPPRDATSRPRSSRSRSAWGGSSPTCST